MTEAGDNKQPSSPSAGTPEAANQLNGSSEGTDDVRGSKPGHHNPTALEVI